MWGRILQFPADPQNSLFAVEQKTLPLQRGHRTRAVGRGQWQLTARSGSRDLRQAGAASLVFLLDCSQGMSPCFIPNNTCGKVPSGAPQVRGLSFLLPLPCLCILTDYIGGAVVIWFKTRQLCTKFQGDLWKQEETLLCFKEYTCEKYSCVWAAGPFSWTHFGKAWLFWLSWAVLILDPNGSV